MFRYHVHLVRQAATGKSSGFCLKAGNESEVILAIIMVAIRIIRIMIIRIIRIITMIRMVIRIIIMIMISMNVVEGS